MAKTIEQQCRTLQMDCLIRLRSLRAMLDTIEHIVKDDNGIVNDLGEMQSWPTMLDARLASLAVLRRIRDER